MEGEHLAYTPWGEVASAPAGRNGYERVRASDESRIAPGAETLRELFGGEPALILLDELSVYLRKVGSGSARDQWTAFLTSLFEAGDAFRLLGAVGAVSGADRIVTMEGGYETRDGGTFELEFRGPVPDAQPVRAGLRGCNLERVEYRVLRRLSRAGVKLRRRVGAMKQGHALTEDLALALGLLFRTLAPMRSRENMRVVAEGIEAMGREEATYWLAMAMHRKHPRRVLTALRILLTVPEATRRRS